MFECEITELISWVYGLILQSGGLERSVPLRKCTNCWLSDSRFALGSSRVCNKLAARARAVDSAMRTDKESCIAALMKKHSGGCMSLLTMKMPSPAALGTAVGGFGRVEASV
jgi:hypothetical protein